MINMLINELVAYGTRVHLVEEADKVYITNSLLELFEQMEFSEEEVVKERPLASILDDMCKYAFENGIIEDDTVTTTDLLIQRLWVFLLLHHL